MSDRPPRTKREAFWQWANRHETIAMTIFMVPVIILFGLVSIVWSWVEPFFRANLIWFAMLGVVLPVAAAATAILMTSENRDVTQSEAWLLCTLAGFSVFLVSLWGIATYLWSAVFP